MDDIVPGALQRLREADIVGLAGLANASLGQEYGRNGYVSAPKRRGSHLFGVVAIPGASPEPMKTRLPAEQPESAEELPGAPSAPVRRFEVEVEVVSRTSCRAICACDNLASLICAHAAALLYQWIHRPHTFISLFPALDADATSASPGDLASVSLNSAPTGADVPVATRHMPLPTRNLPVNTVGETLAQLGLSELRAVAREYNLAVVSLGKQQLVETLIEMLSQPEVIRRVVGTLEKAQRQLLAAFALAGGTMSDEELRGLFERFSLDNAGTLQDMLAALQARLLLVRTSFNHSLQQRLHLQASPLDISWYIPQEVRDALHVTLPVTQFDVTVPYGKSGTVLPELRLAVPYRLLEDMLLVARALDGSADELVAKRSARGLAAFAAGRLSPDGSLALPPPEDQPSSAMVEMLRSVTQYSSVFLRFAIRLLRLADLLYKEEDWPVHLQVAPDAARLLLGPERSDTLRNLFVQWVSQASYAELFELAEAGTRVRCRATPLNQPALRRGELEQENSEARQELLALFAQVPPGEWVNFSAFARFIYRLHPSFLQRRQRLFPSPHWWIEQEEGRPLHANQLSDWLRAEGRYLASLIQGPLYWWGICDLALSAGDQLLAFRLNPLADQLFQGVTPTLLETQAEGMAVVSPALNVSLEEQLLVPCASVNWPLIAVIEHFAESTGVQQGQLSYSLNAQSLGAALSQGRDPRELLTLLAQVAQREENSALHHLLANLERRIANYGRVRLYTGVSLVQVADSSVMQQLEAMTSLDEQTIRAIHPTALLLKKQGVERLMEELKRRGQAPLLHEEG